MKKIILFFFALLFFTDLSAQDKHFTQFYASPLTLNPALTGAYIGRYRLSTIYRDQWRNVVETPFRTFAAELDVRFDVKTNSQYKDAAAVGLLFFRDKVTGIDFSTQQIAISGAYHKGLDFDNRQFLTLGFQGGITQRNVNYEQLTFADQFNGINGYTFSSDENLPANNFSFGDLALGLNYAFNPKARTSLFVGAAMHHVFQPQISFYNEELNNDNQPLGDENLYSRYSVQVTAELPLSSAFSISPRVLWATQGPHMEINTGANVKMLLTDFNNNALYLGGWVRTVKNNDDALGVDALVLMAGIAKGNFLFGFSYDANLRDLSTYNQGQGAFEVSISYFGDFEDDNVMCPRF